MIGPLQWPDPASSTCTYLLGDEASRTAILIDPVEEQVERDAAAIAALGLRLLWTVETHVHADHITGALRLANLTRAGMVTPAACGTSGATRQLVHGDRLHFGRSFIEALHTPGHTSGGMCYALRDAQGGPVQLFTGDTLLVGGCGRTDFQGGSADALYDSITGVLFQFDDDAIVWPGHDYGGRGRSSIGRERRENPRLAGRTRDEFRSLMERLQLPRPARMAEAVPANLRMGRHD